MRHLIVGLIIGVVITGAVFLGPLKPLITKTLAEESGSTQTQVTSTTGDTDKHSTGNVKLLLQEAGSQISNKDTATYYNKLVEGYELKDTTLNEEQICNESSVLSVMPDIQKINSMAITMPLTEAGKNIKDEDIAKFYYKFLSDSGWDIK